MARRVAIRVLLRGFVLQPETLTYINPRNRQTYTAEVGPISTQSLLVGLGIHI